jgi:hypothetical protein
MKNLKKTLYFMVAVSTLFYSCAGSDNNQSSNNVAPTPAIDNSNQEKEKEEPRKVEHYQLNTIQGMVPPRGAFFDFNPQKGKWCQRPDHQMVKEYLDGIGNTEGEIPDLADYFNDKATNLLNSCIVTFTTQGENKTVSLRLGGNIVFRQPIENDVKEIKIKGSMKNFNFAKLGGTLMFDDGKDFTLSFAESTPVLRYTNDYGQFDFNFIKLDLKKMQRKIAVVTSDIANFYFKPDQSSKQKSFVVKGQNVLLGKSQDDFVYAYFTNTQGTVTEGWLLSSDFKKND